MAFSTDEETFLSADDLRINVCNLQIHDGNGLNTVNIKPECMSDLTDVITFADLHPLEYHFFMQSSFFGVVKLGDVRHNSAARQLVQRICEEAAALRTVNVLLGNREVKVGCQILARQMLHSRTGLHEPEALGFQHGA